MDISGEQQVSPAVDKTQHKHTCMHKHPHDAHVDLIACSALASTTHCYFQLDVDHNLFKQRLDKFGNPIRDGEKQNSEFMLSFTDEITQGITANTNVWC